MKKQLFFAFAFFCINLLSFGQYVGENFSVNGDNRIYYRTTSIAPFTVSVGTAYTFNIANVNIPASVSYNGFTYAVTEVMNFGFQNRSTLTNIILPNTINTIGVDAFYNCRNLVSASIDNASQLNIIGDYAFFGCPNLTSINIPDSVTEIRDSAFEGCSNLSTVTISNSNSLTNIGAGAFSSCPSLTSFTIPNGVTTIATSAFEYCTGLTSFTIPNWVTNIGDSGFAGCSNLTSFIIGNSVTNIGFGAFYHCIGLTSLSIPNSVTTIGDYAFQECNGFATFTIPNSIVSVGQGVFYNCSGLTSVFIPSSVTSIGNQAFGYCYALTSVTVNWVSPLVVNANVFQNLDTSTIILYVPFGTKAAYEADVVWTNFIITEPLDATQSQNNVSCFGGSDGSATVLVTNGVAPFTYSWSPSGGSNATISGLVAGNYTCTIADAALNSITRDFVITESIAIPDNITTVTACGEYTWANNGQTYTISGIYAGSTTNCVTEKLDLTVNSPIPTRNMSINGTLCNGATIGTLISKFNNSANVSCYAASTGGVPLSTTDLIAPVNASVNFYLTQTIDGCESERILYNAFVNFVTPPNAAATQSFCSGATVANLVATPGSSGIQACCLNWFTTPTVGTALPSTTVLASGIYYVGQLHISGCVLERTMVTVTILPATIAAPNAISTQIYAGSGTIANLTATGTNLQWYENITGGTVLASTSTLADGTTYYVSQSNSCAESTRTLVTVHKISEASQSFCDGATVASLITTPSNGNIVQWYNTNTATNALAATDVLTSGIYYVEQSSQLTYNTIIDSGLLYPRGVAVQQDGKILFADSDSYSVKRMNADGSNIEILISNQGYPTGIAIQQDGKIVFADANSNIIKRMNADGSGIETLGSGFNFPNDVAIQQDGKIIIADRNSNQIKRMNPDGTNIEVLGSGFNFPSGVAIQQDGKIVIADTNNNAIKRMNADGTNIEILGSGLSVPTDVVIQNNGKIVFTNDNYGVKRMDSSGLNIEMLITGCIFPYGIALEQNGNIIVAENYYSKINRIINAYTTPRIAVQVNITPNSINTTAVAACDSYSWNGTTYTASGVYTGVTVNCVTEKLDLTITPSTDNTTMVAACDSYTWNGTTYTASGVYTGSTTNCVTE
ncbi:MAG: leucine-rich repeat protein, partial [Flavobacterium sp.]|nr:leucine-rich repeat protein [Flavobacterium sp.]